MGPAWEEGVPAADVSRCGPPDTYQAVLQKVRDALDGPGANEGLELARALASFAPWTRAAAQWAHNNGAPDESVRLLQNYAFTFGHLQEKVRDAAPQRRLLAHKLQRWYAGLGLQMCKTLVSELNSPVDPWEIDCGLSGSGRGLPS